MINFWSGKGIQQSSLHLSLCRRGPENRKDLKVKEDGGEDQTEPSFLGWIQCLNGVLNWQFSYPFPVLIVLLNGEVGTRSGLSSLNSFIAFLFSPPFSIALFLSLLKVGSGEGNYFLFQSTMDSFQTHLINLCEYSAKTEHLRHNMPHVQMKIQKDMQPNLPRWPCSMGPEIFKLGGIWRLTPGVLWGVAQGEKLWSHVHLKLI